MIFYQKENVGKSYECRIGTYENWFISPHIHEYSEIVFTKKRETCVYLDGKRFIVPENHLIYIKPNQVHEFSTESSSVLCAAVFSNDLNPLFNYLTLGKVLSCPVIDFSEHLSLLEEFENVDQDDKMRACGLLNLICGVILKRGEWTSTRALAQGQSGLKQIVDYISKNFRDDIKISDLAKILGYHEKYLSGAFHALTNMNFRTLLASYRISCAKELLRAESARSLRISDVALQCGFSSINTFHRAFREITGTTPKQYLAGKHATKQTN